MASLYGALPLTPARRRAVRAYQSGGSGGRRVARLGVTFRQPRGGPEMQAARAALFGRAVRQGLLVVGNCQPRCWHRSSPVRFVRVPITQVNRRF